MSSQLGKLQQDVPAETGLIKMKNYRAWSLSSEFDGYYQKRAINFRNTSLV